MITPPNVRIDNASGLNNSIISVAQQAYYFYANQLDLGGIFSSQKIIRVDGYEIILNLNKDFNYGFISGVADITSPIVIKKDDKVCNIYMESGFFDLLSTGQCTEGAYFPAVLNYDADILAYIDLLDNPLQGSVSILGDTLGGEKILDGSVSNSLSCSEKLDTIIDPCGNEYTGGGYCQDLVKLKDAQTVMPSSMFSGKLRLYVQSIYGSARSDYKRDGFILKIGDDNNPEEAEDYPIFDLPRGFTGSSWLYTTSNYDYFLCTRDQTVVIFTPLELTPCAIEFRDILIANPQWSFEEKKKVEAYILAYARLTTKGEMVVSIDGDDIIGSPLDYGWHSTWDGSEASVVCFYDDPAAPQYLSDQHQITIQESFIDDQYIFTVTNTRIQSDKPWWPWTNGLQVLYYSESEESMIPVEYPAILFGGFTGTFDSPLYCYYALDETSGVSELIVCNIHMDIGTQTSTNFNLPTGTRFSTPQRYKVVEKISFLAGDEGGKKGFSVNGQQTEVDVGVTTQTRLTEYYPLGQAIHRGWPFDRNAGFDSLLFASGTEYGISKGLVPGETKEVFDPDSGTFRTTRWEWRGKWLFMGREITDNIGNEGTSGQVFFELPLGDCSNAITGVTTDSFQDESTFHTVQETVGVFNGVYFPYEGQLVWYVPTNASGYKILEVIAEAPSDDAMTHVSSFWGNTQTIVNEEIVGFASQKETKLNTHDKGTFKNEVTDNKPGNPEYFAPTISDKPTHTIDTGRRSIENKYKINHSAFNRDGGFINDSSIGWA